MYVVTLRHACALTVVDLSAIGNKCENAELNGSRRNDATGRGIRPPLRRVRRDLRLHNVKWAKASESGRCNSNDKGYGLGRGGNCFILGGVEQLERRWWFARFP